MVVVTIALVVLVAELALVLALSGLRRVGSTGIRLSSALCEAPLLDVLVFGMTLLPPVVGFAIASWPGAGGALLGQMAAVPAWVVIHERVLNRSVRGPRLLWVQNAALGRWRNHVALWLSVLALPLFLGVRIGEILIYPPMRWLVRFPRYRHGEWVNVSRHKFEGLIGHDLFWCLYCDWMTGVYSLAGEMLRNVESFWCPIRFDNSKKCENCRVDFPDVDRWAVPDGSIAPAVELFERQYADGRREWFGHPARLTVNGEPVANDGDGGGS